MVSNNQMQDIMNQTLETEPIYESPDLLQFLFGDNLGWPMPDASIGFPDAYPSMDNGLLALTAPNSPPPLEEGPSAVKYMTNLIAHIVSLAFLNLQLTPPSHSMSPEKLKHEALRPPS